MKIGTKTALASLCFVLWFPFLEAGTATANDQQPIGVLFAAGDISRCGSKPRHLNDEKTADLIRTLLNHESRSKLPYRLLALGDLAYDKGRASDFKCFDRSWGRFKKSILPVPGNHDYDAHKDAAPFFQYFKNNEIVSSNGSRAGYYSLNFPDKEKGPWQIIAVNPYRNYARQIKWLRSVSVRNRHITCLLAFWHPYIHSSGRHGHKHSKNPNAKPVALNWMKPAYRILHKNAASIILMAHDHNFEAFDRQNADGVKTLDGPISFVVGTGGGRLYRAVRYKIRAPNSTAYTQDDHGVLEIKIYKDKYEWKFHSINKNSVFKPEYTAENCNRKF